MTGWRAARTPPWRPGGVDWLLVLARGLVIGTVTYSCLVFLLLLRLIEAPLFAPRRPVTPWITQFVCRAALLVMGIRLVRGGQPMTGDPMCWMHALCPIRHAYVRSVLGAQHLLLTTGDVCFFYFQFLLLDCAVRVLPTT